MNILIKGMEMPKSCYKCPLRRRDGMDIVCPVAHERFSIADINILDYRLDNCPLVPVPPHGDLIDRDALMDSDGDLWDGMWGWSGMKIMNAPIIIPAEEDE